ncbi:class I SAM-dependent methyltransferase [Micromonospora matsumotoense]|uniref:class I SAM-dependent methyltransferase n=1 Tax=Micromonospora matsumotoense TaxID=121616 RepID=UPI003D8F5385
MQYKFDEAGFYSAGAADRFGQLFSGTDMGRAEAVETARFIEGYANGGSILELGVGDGRVAVELAALGLSVHGVDGSDAMLSALKERDPDGRIEVTQGDFAESLPDGTFDVVFISYGTLFLVGTQERQLRTMELAASRLKPSGVTIIETYNPYLHLHPRDENIRALVLKDRVMLEVEVVDRNDQRVVNVVVPLDGGTEADIATHRWIWLSELDLMARHAGLELRARFGGWNREPVGHAMKGRRSERYVSVHGVAVQGSPPDSH